MRKTKKVICELFVDMLLFNSLEGKVLSTSKISRKELYIKAFHKAVSLHSKYELSDYLKEGRAHAYIYVWLIDDALDKKILNKIEANDLLGDLYFKRKGIDTDYWHNWEIEKERWAEQESTKDKPYKFFYFHDNIED